MKKLLFSSLLLIFLVSPLDVANGQITQGGWTCIEGKPRTDIEWVVTPNTDYYKIYRNGIYIASADNPATQYSDYTAGYRTYYRYEIRSFRYPEIVASEAHQAVDVTTGSCAFVSSLTGNTSVYVGTEQSYTAEFVADTYMGNTMYDLWLYNPQGVGLQLINRYALDGTGPLTGVTSFPSAGTYRVEATVFVPYPSIQSPTVHKRNLTITVENPPIQYSDRNVTVNNSKVATVTAGVPTTVKWTASGVSSCYSGQPDPKIPAEVAKVNREIPVSPDGTANTTDENVVFVTPTQGEAYKIELNCPPREGYALNNDSSPLAQTNVGLGAFFNFVRIAYAGVGNPDNASVWVNAQTKPVLSVDALMYPDTPGGPSYINVDISGTQPGTSGRTPFTISNLDSINTTLTAPPPASGKAFLGWTNCDSKNDTLRTCTVSLSAGNAKTVTAQYGPGSPQGPDLRVDSPIGISPNPANFGANITMSATVRNAGDASTNGLSSTRLYIDYDNNGGGTAWDYTADQSTGNLSAGGTENESWIWQANRAGTHAAKVCADVLNNIIESNEGNNCSDTRTFTVNASAEPSDPYARLNVQSSGATYVTISRVSGPTDIGGTTNPYSYVRAYEMNISPVLRAPLAVGDADFSHWSGCGSTPNGGQDCAVSVNTGQEKTVVANYTTPTPPPPPAGDCPAEAGKAKLCVSSSGISGLQISRFSGPSDLGGTTYYERTYTSALSGMVHVPLTNPEGKRFTGWTGGCTNYSPGSVNCDVNVGLGVSKIITANYVNDNTPPQGEFDYTLSDTSPLTINKAQGGGYKIITITRTSGISEGVSINAVGMPAGVSISYANRPCGASCETTINFIVSPATANGTYPITVYGTPLNKQLTFNLIITGSTISVSCTASPLSVLVGHPVTWEATPSGGTPPYSYIWSGTGIPTDPPPTANPFSVTYSTIGPKTANVEVTTGTGAKANCTSAATVQVNFDPRFEEF